MQHFYLSTSNLDYALILVQVYHGGSLFNVNGLVHFSAQPLLFFDQYFNILDGDSMACGQVVITDSC